MLYQNLKVKYSVISTIQCLKFFVLLTKLDPFYCLHVWFIGKRFNQILLFSVDNIIYEHNEVVYLVCHKSFSQRNVNSILYIICEQLWLEQVYITLISYHLISLITLLLTFKYWSVIQNEPVNHFIHK